MKLFPCLFCVMIFGSSAVADSAIDESRSRLSLEIERVQMAPVHAFLRDGGDPNTQTETGRTLLETATNWNYRDLVRALLGRGADPNKCGTDNVCALYIAVGRDTEIVRILLESGAEVNRVVEKYAYSPLCMAARNRQDTFDRLIKAGNYRGPMPNSLEAVKLLVLAGANVNHVDSFGDSPLRVAMRSGNLNIARLLIESGADVSQHAGEGTAAAEMGGTILMEAISSYTLRKDLSEIRLLLDHGANPNDKSDLQYNQTCESRGICGWGGYSALGFAAKNGLYGVVKLLLEYGADPMVGRNDGVTPLELSIKYGRPRTAVLLRETIARLGRDTDLPP